MPDTSADRALAEATISALDQRSFGHPALHLRAIEILLDKLGALANASSGTLEAKDFEAMVAELAAQAFNKSDAVSEIMRTLVDAYHLFQRDNNRFKLLQGELVTAPWLGVDLSLTARQNSARRRMSLAHIHALAYPEIVDALEQFAAPGKRKTSAEDSLRDRFIFGRKVNSTIAGFLVSACMHFKMVEEVDPVLRARWAPPPVLAAIVIRRYLLLTSYRPDTAHETNDVLNQASFVLPRQLFERHPTDFGWLKALGSPQNVIRREVGGAMMRITMDGLTWFAGAGLISPVDCGRILRTRRAKDALGRVREALIRRMARLDQPPINANEIEADLQPE